MANPKLQLASELIQKAVLDQLYFDRCNAERLVIGQAPRQLKMDFEFGGTGRITSPTTFEAAVVFRLVANGEDGAGVVKLRCGMIVKYRVEPGVTLRDDAVGAFAEINGVFNAWPYFREYVQSTVQRLGLGITITVPLLRLNELIARVGEGETKAVPDRKAKRPA